MFEPLKYMESTFSIMFPRQADIRRKANSIEDKINKIQDISYSQPQIIPIPDELDPRIPRIIFGSMHGFSQILLSQVSLALHVTYSEDWQVDESKIQGYLLQRVPILYQLLNLIDPGRIFISGLSTVATLPFTGDDKDVISKLSRLYLTDINRNTAVHELNIKHVDIVDNRYFSNVTVQNYRTWDNLTTQEPVIPETVQLPLSASTKRGVAITVDFNDRYSFNEEDGYNSSEGAAKEIIERAFVCINGESKAITEHQI